MWGKVRGAFMIVAAIVFFLIYRTWKRKSFLLLLLYKKYCVPDSFCLTHTILSACFLFRQTLKETHKVVVWERQSCVCVFPREKVGERERERVCFQLWCHVVPLSASEHGAWKFILRIYWCQGIIFDVETLFCSQKKKTEQQHSRERSITPYTHTHTQSRLMARRWAGGSQVGAAERSRWDGELRNPSRVRTTTTGSTRLIPTHNDWRLFVHSPPKNQRLPSTGSRAKSPIIPRASSPQSNRGLHSDTEAYDFLSLSRSQPMRLLRTHTRMPVSWGRLTQTWGCITTNKLHLPSPVLSHNFVALPETMSPEEDHSLVMDRFIGCSLPAPPPSLSCGM